MATRFGSRSLPRTVGLVTLLCLFLIVVAASCGKGGSFVETTASVRSHGAKAPAVLRPVRRVLLSDVLRQVDECPAPEKVDPNMFGTLKNKLKAEFVKRSDGKYISIAPTGFWITNQVSDLKGYWNKLCTHVTLNWTEALWSDFDNSGEVNIADLQPLAAYYGQRSDTGPDDGKLIQSSPAIGADGTVYVGNSYYDSGQPPYGGLVYAIGP